MMDLIILSPADGLEVVHQNGVHDEPSNSGEDGVVSNDVDSSATETTETITPNGNVEENFNQSDSAAPGNPSIAEIEGSNNNMDSKNMTIAMEEVKITDQTEQSRAPKGMVKNKNMKAPSSSGGHASLTKRSKNGKDKQPSSAVSNVTLALDSRPRQSIKGRPFNDRQSEMAKHSSKSDGASSEVTTAKIKPKSLKKGPVDKVQGEAESSSSGDTEDAKPRRLGMLPDYGFSFKCGERAERRKEFYTKLEEKIQAKEAEKTNMQAKSKETQEAEIKMLRKSLTFKATPMPTFYQEPPPTKVELKKIPITRPKSPKLGRKKSSATSESDGNTSSSSQQGRLSLDEKVLQSNLSKGVTLVHHKKPQRRSLPPRLACAKTSSSNSTASPTSSKAVHDATKKDTSLSNATKKDTNFSDATGEEKIEITAAVCSETSDALPLNAVPSDETSEASSNVNGDIAVHQ